MWGTRLYSPLELTLGYKPREFRSPLSHGGHESRIPLSRPVTANTSDASRWCEACGQSTSHARQTAKATWEHKGGEITKRSCFRHFCWCDRLSRPRAEAGLSRPTQTAGHVHFHLQMLPAFLERTEEVFEVWHLCFSSDHSRCKVLFMPQLHPVHSMHWDQEVSYSSVCSFGW